MKYSILTANGALIRYVVKGNNFVITATNVEDDNIKKYDFDNAHRVSKQLTKLGCLNMVVPAENAITTYKNLFERGEE